VRILVASDQWFPESAGGAPRFATELSTCLAEAGHDVHAIVPRGTAERLPVRSTASIPRTRLPTTLVDPVATFATALALRREAFDVIVAHQVTTAYACAQALRHTPLVLVYHASAPREARLHAAQTTGTRRLMSDVLARVLARLEHGAVAAATAIVPLSAYSRGLVEGDYPSARSKVHALAGAVDTTHFRPAEPDQLVSPRLLLVVRRLEAGLGVEQALEAVALLARDAPLEVKFAGWGRDAESLQARSADLGLENTVTFLGKVSSADLVEWYRRAHVVLIPPAPHEGFGLAALEALACARPAVGTGGALPQLLGDLDKALVAKDASPSALADAVRRAFRLAPDDAFRRRCRDYVVDNFGWVAATHEWDFLLSRLAGGAR
jgi:glycosyltransferase involved in cell wall biosynthesis